MNRISRTILIAALLASAIQLNAQTRATIVSYDVEQAMRSGYGCWSHVYNGTIADIGRTVTAGISLGARVSCTPDGNQIANYTRGSGTLNDGLISTTMDGDELFFFGNADDGQPVRPVITLHLNMMMFIKSIRILSGEMPTNFIPFILTGATVDVSSTSVALSASSFNGDGTDHLLSLVGTPLASVPTNEVSLRDFHTHFEDFEDPEFSITEIIVEGDPVVLAVKIDVRPNAKKNLIISRSQGLIPVAILSSPTLDAPSVINAASLQFGRTGEEKSLVRCEAPHDVNGDGLQDLVCLFDAQMTGFAAGDTVGILTGTTNSGEPIRGEDHICVDMCR